MSKKTIAIFGGGPSGLIAAEKLSASGHAVTVYEQMPTVGRKFLLAGKSGLNLTHAEDFSLFAKRFGTANERLRPALEAFSPKKLRDWADNLGAETFVGSSGRIFPKAMKASPLLRAWKNRLELQGVRILTRYRWIGFKDNAPVVVTPTETEIIHCDAALFAFGGASWPRLGSNAEWIEPFTDKGIKIAPMQPANCGFDVAWSDYFINRFAGEPVKSVVLTSAFGSTQGDFVITKNGLEGGLIYTHAANLRDALSSGGQADLRLDLAPGRSIEKLKADLSRQDTKSSLGNLLRKGAGLTGVKAALVTEFIREKNPDRLAQAIKSLRIPLIGPRPVEEAISSAGGILWDEIDENFMLKKMPGIFVAGEMIDWEAPTGGYLLTACFATGVATANGINIFLQNNE